jgi:hypothetical protein
MLCLYFMGLNLSNRQIADELEMDENSIQEMTTTLRQGIVAQEPTITLEGTVECDEVYVVAGHKGHPESVKKRAQGKKTPIERSTWSWHGGDGQAADFWNDSAWRSGGYKNVGQCTAGNDSAAHRKVHQAGDVGKHGRI